MQFSCFEQWGSGACCIGCSKESAGFTFSPLRGFWRYCSGENNGKNSGKISGGRIAVRIAVRLAGKDSGKNNE